ncbi:MAG: Na(+)-translocating NADH-quinone reductase subunit A [Calditrichaeota bacterium]|nr:Na(+)-translocating NADH-quinone reductase subunit A [Calditrichota bacterium]
MADYKLKKGFDLKVAGKADLKLVELDAPKKAAILPGDFLGLKPKMEVEEGEVVKIGSPLFHDKNNEKIKFSSPVSGKVLAINRGDRRKIVEVVIENDSKNESEKFMVVKADTVGSLKKEDIVENLLKSGMWPLLRQRPFNKIANPDVEPRDIFISAMDTAPLAADVNFIMKDEADDFQLGIDILAKLTTGKVYLSINGKADNLSALKNAKNAEINTFSGPHPAGNVGVHIHHIKPIKSGDKIWYLQPYAVALIGKFFRTGQYPNTRIIATAGTALNERQYYKVTLGTPIASLISEGNINHPEARFVSGNVLTGRKVSAAGYTGFYDNLISVIPEGPKERKLFGWYRLGLKTRSFNRSFLSAWVGPKEYEVNTLINGGKRAFVATGDYEKVIPMDIYPVYLIKSILAEDIVEMEGLGILEVDEEDVALCSYICPSKFDFGGILRQGLDLVEKEG